VAGHRVLVKPSAAKEIDAIGAKKDRQRIVARILARGDDPRPAGCEKLAGAEGRFRARQGNFRIVYAIDEPSRTVDVVKVGHRREVHRSAA
jgi:mRNA interferase RelE/StbE